MTRAAIYVRISSDPEDAKLGVVRQEEDCRALAAVKGWDVADGDVFRDNDLSAYTGKRRPEFERLLAAVAAGGIRAVVARDFSRLTRNNLDRVRLLETCVRQGTTLDFIEGASIDPQSPTGALLAGILGEITTHSSREKAAWQRRAIQQAVEQGRRVGGRRPFGYEADGMAVREPEAAHVRKAYADYLTGVPLYEIAKGLNAAGMTTGQGNRWTGDTVRGMLRNPRYAGLRGYGPASQQGRRKVEATHAAQWPALVERETWEAAVAKSQATSGRGRGHGLTAPRMLLTGVAHCGAHDPETGELCLGSVWGGRRAEGGGSYRCRVRPGHLQRAAAPVDQYVSNEVVRYLSAPDAARLLARRDAPDAAALRARRTALETRLDALADALGTGDLDAGRYRTQVSRVREELAVVEAEQAAAGAADLIGPLVQAEDVQALWDELGTARQREVIRSLVDVTIRPPGRGVRNFNPRSVWLLWNPRSSEEMASEVLQRLP